MPPEEDETEDETEANLDPFGLFTGLAARPQTEPGAESLEANLLGAFGHSEFRAHQREVCERLTRGEHLLLVMPTGAGKSLCYQLPGISRGGTTLVISPLIALMEDQVIALQRCGLRAERIHSGRDRLHSRAVCKAYVEDQLDFLFIAPERLRVPGFPELLARRPLSLIAVDEAHCISQWGHDFRPDYRLLRERLSVLGDAPIVALTATATPDVQDDIAVQLGVKMHRSIHGFRRHNLAVEVAEVLPKARSATALRVLSEPDRLPAILYAPTRKKAEALAGELQSKFSAAAYHAGMPADERDDVQRRFLSDELDVIVATIAFGMGVDKPNVRTVMHVALPGSVEGYYQEIGRAGRDGKPSVAILLHSFQDRRTHEWFHERDYPDPDELSELYNRLGAHPEPPDSLAAALGWDDEKLERALDKLRIHGGAGAETYDGITRGNAKWRAGYEKQRAHRKSQLDRIAAYVETPACRMLQVVEHFGDQEDDGEPCGTCDVCDPTSGYVQRYREPTDAECEQLAQVLAMLEHRSPAVGELHRETLGEAVHRSDFEKLVAALCRAGWARMESASFVREGREIGFRRLAQGTAWTSDAAPTASEMRGTVQVLHTTKMPRAAGGRARRASRASGSSDDTSRPARPRDTAALADALEAPAGVVDTLREWRLDQSRERGVPAFRIFSNRTLGELARERPSDIEELSAIPGIGKKFLERHADDLLELLAQAG